MAHSEILKDKLILAVDDEEDVLDIIEEELSSVGAGHSAQSDHVRKRPGVPGLIHIRPGDSRHYGGSRVRSLEDSCEAEFSRCYAYSTCI